MTSLDIALLDAALTYSGKRMQALLTSSAADAGALLAGVLGAPPTQAQLDQLAPITANVESHRSAALAGADAVITSLAMAPQSLSDVATPCAHLAGALTELAAAVSTLGAVSGTPSQSGGMQQLLRTAAGGLQAGGLVAQLGLGPGPDALTVNGTVLHLTLKSPGTVTIEGALLFALTDGELAVSFDWTTAASLTITFTATIQSGLVADEFVRKLVPASANAKGKVKLTVSPADGITFGPGVRHRISIPGHIDAFGVELRNFAIELPDPSELGAGTVPALALTATIAGTLGPISAVVEGLGVELDIGADAVIAGTDDPLALAVRPPHGAGLSVDAGPVKGGGYVQHEHDEYGGALDLALAAIEIKAVGLISTDPFSLVLVLSVEFDPGIQLSFGFTLNGIGGLLALERTVSTDALRDGLHNHTVDSLLFPADPVKAAPHILEALDRSFPQQPGAFVVGPMLEIGWGVPISLVTAKVGVLLALTDPKIILLGAVRVALPQPDAAIVDLRAELYGEITPDHLLVLVSLAGSRVAGFALSGDFGLLIAYGDRPDFAITAGGFHPHYRPPAELVGMHRVAVDLSPPALLTLRADAYFALTANSFQLGTHVQLRADLAVVTAEGHLGFDALVRWSPRFSFEIDLNVGIAVYVFGESFCGVELDLHLEGPGPWLAHGTGSVSFLFFDVDFEVGPITWGDGDNPPPDARSPVDLVAKALDNRKSWHAVSPEGGDRVAKLRTVTVAGDVILVHPLGAFEVRQQVVPLETTIDRIGPHPVTEHRVNLTDPLVGNLPAKAVSETTDRFAPGQFLDLTDDEKLSRPAFEDLPSGMRLSGASTDAFGTPKQSDYQWDTVYPHDDFDRERHPVWFSPVLRATALGTGPVAVSALRAESAYHVDRTPVVLADPGTALIRSTDDLAAVAGIPGTAMTTTAAARLLTDALDGLAAPGSLQLVGLGVV